MFADVIRKKQCKKDIWELENRENGEKEKRYDKAHIFSMISPHRQNKCFNLSGGRSWKSTERQTNCENRCDDYYSFRRKTKNQWQSVYIWRNRKHAHAQHTHTERQNDPSKWSDLFRCVVYRNVAPDILVSVLVPLFDFIHIFKYSSTHTHTQIQLTNKIYLPGIWACHTSIWTTAPAF